MPILAVSQFNWPALQTDELKSADEFANIQDTFCKWTTACDQNIEQLALSCCNPSKRKLVSTFWIMNNLIRSLMRQCTFKPFSKQRCFVVYDRKQVVQGIALIKETDFAVNINTLMTSPENIGKGKGVRGVGTLLMKRIAAELCSNGCTKPIELTPTESSIGFYTKLGFKGAETVLDTKCLFVAADKIAELYKTCSRHKERAL